MVNVLLVDNTLFNAISLSFTQMFGVAVRPSVMVVGSAAREGFVKHRIGRAHGPSNTFSSTLTTFNPLAVYPLK